MRSIPEANKLRKAIPGMLRDQVKEFENLAVRLYEVYAHSPDLVFLLPEFFVQRWRDEEKNGWVHTAERTLLGSPQVSFRDALLLFLRERVPRYFEESIMAHRNLEISREYAKLLQAADSKASEAHFDMRRNVVEMAHAAVEALRAQGQTLENLQVPLEPTYEVFDPEEAEEEFKSSPLPAPPVQVKPEQRDDEDPESEEASELDEDDSLDPDDTHTCRSVKALAPYDLVRYAYDYQHDRRTVERILRYADRGAISRARIFRPKFGTPEEWQSAAEDPPVPFLVKPGATPWKIVFDLMHVNWAVWKAENEDMEAGTRARVRQLCDQVLHSAWMQYFLAPEEVRQQLRVRSCDKAKAFWASFEH